MDEHNVAQVARPGTSLARPATSAAGVGPAMLLEVQDSNQQRAVSSSHQPVTTFSLVTTVAQAAVVWQLMP